MKILFYIDEIGGGGAERVMANLANGFIEKGEEVILVTSFPKSKEYTLSNRIKRYNLEEFQPLKRNFIKKKFWQNTKVKKNLSERKMRGCCIFFGRSKFSIDIFNIISPY